MAYIRDNLRTKMDATVIQIHISAVFDNSLFTAKHILIHTYFQTSEIENIKFTNIKRIIDTYQQRIHTFHILVVDFKSYIFTCSNSLNIMHY